MAFTFTEFSPTVSTSEISLSDGGVGVEVNTTNGLVCAFAEVVSIAVGDLFVLKLWEKTISSGTQRLVGSWTLDYANPSVETPMVLVGNGWDFSVIKISGTDRVIQTSLRFIPE